MPNITGSFGFTDDGTTTRTIRSKDLSGAFSSETINQPYCDFGVGNTIDGTGNVTFNASKSNTIYGSSATVQPPTIRLTPQIKY